MTTIIPIGLISLVLGILISLLSNFPILGGPEITSEFRSANVETVGSGTLEEANNMLFSGYASVVEGLMSHLDDPELERAENDRDALVSYAESLIQRLDLSVP